MQTRLSLKPGQKGTKKLVAKYGDRLIAVRYRYDVEHKRRYKTVELVVDELPWLPNAKPRMRLPVQLDASEINLHQEVKAAGGQWNAADKVWELEYREVVRLNLEERLMSASGDQH